MLESKKVPETGSFNMDFSGNVGKKTTLSKLKRYKS